MSVHAVAPVGALARGLARHDSAVLAAFSRASERSVTDVVVLGAEPLLAPEDDDVIAPDPFLGALALRGARARPDVLAVAALTRDHPYNLARRTLAAWHLTRGGVGIVLVPDAGAPRTGRDAFLHPPATDEDRLRDAAEALRALWRSWPHGTIVGDRATGVYAQTEDVHAIDHDGVYRIAGPLTTPAAAWGEPVLASWGGSPDWSDLDVTADGLRVGGHRIGDLTPIASVDELETLPARAGGRTLASFARQEVGA